MLKTKYDNFTIEDFASDEHFINWCLDQDDDLNTYWEEWVQNHPKKQGTISEARRMVNLLHRAEETNVQSAMKKDIWNHLNAQISQENTKELKTTTTYFTVRRFVAMAASFLLLFMAYQLFNTPSEQIEWTQYANYSDQTEVIQLSDGTEVTLQPNSSLEYSSLFGDQKREVILQGEAFFDVARDTSKAFLVYANQTITKVLGTSFLVKAIKGGETVEVEVASGSVAVLANVSKEKGQQQPSLIFKKGDVEIPKPNYKVNLTPNEKISFDIDQKDITKSIVSTPKLLHHGSELRKVDFNDDPVTEVFKALEVAYGIHLEYDFDQLNKCSISTVLDDSPLFTKLDIICTALDLNYEQKNAIIYVSGNGC